MSARFELPVLAARPRAEAGSGWDDRAGEPVVDEAAEREQLRADARDEGYAAGLAEAQALMASAVAALEAAVAELTARRDALCDAVEPAAISLALAGAEQVVGAALEVSPELLGHAARGALRRLVDRDHVTVLVHPDDLDFMRRFASEIIDQLGGIDALDVQAERRVAPGGVIVQTPRGDIDARLDTRLAELGSVVRAALAG